MGRARGRSLVVGAPAAIEWERVERPFVVLLPAFDAADRDAAERLLPTLVAHGCRELCCAGPEGELLHDTLDELIASDGVELVTTWHADLAEAVAYFLDTAGGEVRARVALAHPAIRAALVGAGVTPLDALQRRHLERMGGRLDAFVRGETSLRALIADLETLIGSLELDDAPALADLRALWGVLEEVYSSSVALHGGRFDDHSEVLVQRTLAALRDRVRTTLDEHGVCAT